MSRKFAERALIANPDTEHIIVESARYEPRRERRPRHEWTAQEEEYTHMIIFASHPFLGS